MIIDVLNYPDSRPTNHSVIRCANPDFEQELSDILEKCGNKIAFSELYKQRLKYLEESRNNCFLRRQWFEKLKHDTNQRLYSMKFKSGSISKNIRILFICTTTRVILLCAFVENTKQKSYSKNIEIANKRIKQLINYHFIKEEDIICHT